MADNVKSRILDVLSSGVSCLSIKVDLLSSTSVESIELQTLKNSLRIHVMLIKYITSIAEKENAESTAESKVRYPAVTFTSK